MNTYSPEEKFIVEKKLPDSLIRRIRSFYNARNFQFAWFTSKGLTEQGLTFWNIHNYETFSGDTSLKNAALQKKSSMKNTKGLSKESNESV